MQRSLPPTALEEVLLHLRMMATEVDAVSGAAAEHMSLNRTELRALHCLRAMGDSATAGDLARMLALTTGATTRVIDGLVDHGHAQRMPDAQDRRRTVVVLTPSVKAQLKVLFVPLGEEMRRELREMNIEDDALAAMSRVLDVARRLMREHTHRLHHSALSTTVSQGLSVGTDDHSSERQ
ncbi:MAG: MarR family transcriptional regulator [Candidatus Dormibacteraeota bacterium]|uniref:MarR family transcriptional regulator n=1 Tax=Candidatus Dormiibacter inghamiae TaxID=3127013 RepID=A0A934NG32_9BACT|nr:MarR family transcriptional regulator [Candidatus Dormibacteraeota bacterium]MBJ7606810.1 MarR family transcriptional regulator [Candidatus Dormibacteraeota bacterium]